MKVENTQIKKYLWITPAIVALLIALIPTLNLQWPLTADIFYQIHLAQVYSQYGLTLTDPLVDPGFGYKINYPPLFALVLAFIKLFSIDYFQAAKLMQPLLAFFTVLSVSYVAKKFYNDIAGISAGFLIISSYLFSRLVSPLPETMALIFVPLAVYYFYRSVENKKYFYALISGLLFVFVVMTHQATILILFLVITAIAIVVGLFKRNIRYFTSYGVFLLIPVLAGISILLVLFLIIPDYIQNIITNGLTVSTGYTTFITVTESVSYAKYIAYMSIAFPFAIVGAAIAIWKRRDKDIVLLVWIITIFLISKSYWFGINVISVRLLIHLLIPVSILAGFGLSYLYTDFKKNEFPNPKLRSAFLILILLLSSLFAVTTVNDPNFGLIPKFAEVNKDGLKSPQIAPPTNSDEDLAQWFIKNGDKKSVVASNSFFISQFITANTGQPIASFYRVSLWQSEGLKHIIMTNSSSSYYFILDKRFTYYSNSNEGAKAGEFAYFYNNKTYNPDYTIPGNKIVVYENKDYKVYKIQPNSRNI